MTDKIEPLWEHQQITKAFALSRGDKPIYDGSDPGTGKTRAHLELFAERRRRGGGRALVVAPLTILKTAWEADCKRFTPDMTIAHSLAGTYQVKGEKLSKRRRAFESGADIVTMNTDGVKWFAKTPHAVRLLKHFDTLIIDEVTYFKHRTSQRSRDMRILSQRFKYKTVFSGTPRSLSVTDLWHQIYILDYGQALGTSFSAFRSEFCIPHNNGFGIEWTDRPRANEQALQLLGHMFIRHAFQDVMDVPPNSFHRVSFEMTRAHRNAYKEMEDTCLIEMAGGDVSAVNAAVLRQKLLQIASGAVYDDKGVKQVFDDQRAKIVADLVHERDRSVVFFNWTHQREQLVKAFTGKRIPHAYIDGTVSASKRAEIVDAFQAGAYKALLLHPDTGAHGLTLTRATATIWASPIYRPDVFKQGIHRVYRGGQKKPTENIVIEAEGTCEHEVYSILRSRERGMVSLLDMLAKDTKDRADD